MKIRTPELGYREIARIADFIKKIENGNEYLQIVMLRNSETVLTYDLQSDDVVIVTSPEYRIYTADDILEGRI